MSQVQFTHTDVFSADSYDFVQLGYEEMDADNEFLQWYYEAKGVNMSLPSPSELDVATTMVKMARGEYNNSTGLPIDDLPF